MGGCVTTAIEASQERPIFLRPIEVRTVLGAVGRATKNMEAAEAVCAQAARSFRAEAQALQETGNLLRGLLQDAGQPSSSSSWGR